MDVDDFISPYCLGTLYKAAIEHHAQILQFGFRISKPDDFVVLPPTFDDFVAVDSIQYLKSTRAASESGAVWRVIFSHDFLREIDAKFNIHMPFSEDNLFMMEALACCNRMVKTQTICYHYVQHEESMIHTLNRTNWQKQATMKSDIAIEIIKTYFSKQNSMDQAGLQHTIIVL